MDLEELKSTAGVLKEIAYEPIKRAVFLQVAVHLVEHFIQLVNSVDGLRI